MTRWWRESQPELQKEFSASVVLSPEPCKACLFLGFGYEKEILGEMNWNCATSYTDVQKGQRLLAVTMLLLVCRLAANWKYDKNLREGCRRLHIKAGTILQAQAAFLRKLLLASHSQLKACSFTPHGHPMPCLPSNYWARVGSVGLSISSKLSSRYSTVARAGTILTRNQSFGFSKSEVESCFLRLKVRRTSPKSLTPLGTVNNALHHPDSRFETSDTVRLISPVFRDEEQTKSIAQSQLNSIL